jgi:hypothetical protein
MMRIGRMSVLVALAMLCGVSAASAQDARDAALKRDVERRFEVRRCATGSPSGRRRRRACDRSRSLQARLPSTASR